MKKLRIEIKLWFAELLMGWAFSMAPNTKDGNTIKYFIGSYFDTFKTEIKQNEANFKT